MPIILHDFPETALFRCLCISGFFLEFGSHNGGTLNERFQFPISDLAGEMFHAATRCNDERGNQGHHPQEKYEHVRRYDFNAHFNQLGSD